MPDSLYDDPTIPPPGKRSGTGIRSIVPYLKKSLATKPQVPPQPEDVSTVPQLDFPKPPSPKPRRPK